LHTGDKKGEGSFCRVFPCPCQKTSKDQTGEEYLAAGSSWGKASILTGGRRKKNCPGHDIIQASSRGHTKVTPFRKVKKE